MQSDRRAMQKQSCIDVGLAGIWRMWEEGSVWPLIT